MTPDQKILVVGTTEDYVTWIRKADPGKAIFLVDDDGRRKRFSSYPSSDDEIITDLSRLDGVWKALIQYLDSRNLSLRGIVSFDCEYMALTSQLADRLQLPYPSLSAVLNCRDKFLSKTLWQREGVPCPRASLVSTLNEARLFFSDAKAPCVLKPLTGSGSELVFVLKHETDLLNAFKTVKEGLSKRAGSAMYGEGGAPLMVMETWVEGEEYSCDFLIENGSVEILRLTRKIYYPDGPFGTTWAYILLPVSFLDREEGFLGEQVRKAATALGIDRAISMVDFIVKKSVPHFLEMTPRPGGDCLPHLLKAFFQVDMLKMALDFSVTIPWPKSLFPKIPEKKQLAGVRIFSEKAGVLKKIHTDAVLKAYPVTDIYLKYPEGHLITLPPDDYDSWILGHVAVTLDPKKALLTELRDIKNMIRVEMRS